MPNADYEHGSDRDLERRIARYEAWSRFFQVTSKLSGWALFASAAVATVWCLTHLRAVGALSSRIAAAFNGTAG